MRRPIALVAALALAVSGCATTSTTSPTLSQQAQTALSDVSLIATGLNNSFGILIAQPPAGLDTATLAKLQADLATISVAAEAVQKDLANSQPATEVTQITVALEDIATVVMPLIPGASSYAGVIAAAEALLPFVEAAAGIAGAAPQAHAMDPAVARAVLLKAAAS